MQRAHSSSAVFSASSRALDVNSAATMLRSGGITSIIALDTNVVQS